jgi:hypothetical protein
MLCCKNILLYRQKIINLLKNILKKKCNFFKIKDVEVLINNGN